MIVVKTIEQVRSLIKKIKNANKTIAFIPTMGKLHSGHIYLVKKGAELADCVIVSIFVNPMQFSINEDFSAYPRDYASDIRILSQEKVEVLFMPDTATMYPKNTEQHTRISVNSLDNMHCGASRPAFFTGIATIVAKFFNIIEPDFAVFGEKDFQQLCVIKKMVVDLMFAVKIVDIPIVRDASGLALSSRNYYLNEQEKQQASNLYQIIIKIATCIKKGNKNFQQLSEEAILQMKNCDFVPDYCNIVNQKTLTPAVIQDKELIILAACTLGKTRLIDNIRVSAPEKFN